MNITPVQNNKQSFTSVNLVQVSKTAFQNPMDFKVANKTFINICNKSFGELNGNLSNLLTLFGFGKQTNKTLAFLESPLFINIKKLCEKKKLPNPQKIMDEDYFSFYILTKGNKDAAFDMLKQKSKVVSKEVNLNDLILRCSAETSKIRTLFAMYKLEMLKIVDKAIVGTIETPQKVFKAESLSELPGICKQIEV